MVPKAEDYETIARLDYARFLESLPTAFYHQLDANQLEVQAILGKDFEGLVSIKVDLDQKRVRIKIPVINKWQGFWIKRRSGCEGSPLLAPTLQ